MGLWNVFQEVEIQQLRADRVMTETNQAGREVTLQDRAYKLEDRFEKLLLVTSAMWELLAERGGVTHEDLQAKIVEIAERDGHRDGRRLMPPRRCGQCGAAVPKDRATCVFCGHAEPGSTALDDV